MTQLSNAVVSSNGSVNTALSDAEQIQKNTENIEKIYNYIQTQQSDNNAKTAESKLELQKLRMKLSAEFRPKVPSLGTSLEFANLFKAFSQFTGVIETASKSMINGAFGSGSNYADINDYLNATNKLLSKFDLSFNVRCLGSRDGIAQLEGVLMWGDGENCEWINSYMDVDIRDRNGNITNQSRGSGMTYGRRYLMSSLLNLGANDDDGNATSPDKKVAESKTSKKKGK